MKNSNNFKQAEIGLIPEEWDVAKLGDYLEEKKIKNSENKKLPVYSVSNIYGFILSDTFFDKRVYSKNLNTYKLVQKDAFAYNPYRINVGSIGLFNNNEIGLVSSAYVVFMISKRDFLSEEFLFLLLKSDRFINEIKRISMSRGSVRRTLSFKDLIQIKIPLPPFPEQQRIAKVLSKIQQAMEQQDEIIVATKNLKKSLMKKLFTEGLGHTEFKETEIGQIPKSWDMVRLGEVAETKYGYQTSISKVSEERGVPIISMADITQEGKILWHKIRIINVGEKVVMKHKLRLGEVLFNWRNSPKYVGKTAVFDRKDDIPYICASFLLRISTKPSLNNKFLHYLLSAMRMKGYFFQKSRRAVGQTNFNASVLSGTLILFPPLSEQQKIAHILSTVDKKIKTEEKRKDTLRELFKTMLHKLMTGEIRLKDIEI